MDQLLLHYLDARNESEREQYLDELLVVNAAPVVRRTLRQKLGFHVNQVGLNPHNPDAEDLYHEIIAKIIEVLAVLLDNPRTEIEKFEPYVAGIATNGCLDYMRAKSPARTRLKYSIREILTRKSEFIVTKSGEGLVCSLKAWGSNRKPVTSQRLLRLSLSCRPFGQPDLGAKILHAGLLRN